MDIDNLKRTIRVSYYKFRIFNLKEPNMKYVYALAVFTVFVAVMAFVDVITTIN